MSRRILHFHASESMNESRQPRTALWMIAALTLAATLATAQAPPTPADEPAPRTWIGHNLEELEEFWGEPTKVKRKSDGCMLAHFKYQIPESSPLFLEETDFSGYVLPSATGGPHDPIRPSVETPLYDGHADVAVATQKARFWLDERGVVVSEKIGKLKWKKGHRPDDRP